MKDEILYRVQKNFPLVIRPFEQIAKELNTTEDEVIKILQEEKENNIIRQTSSIFDTKRLGYTSSLVAFEIDADKDALDISGAFTLNLLPSSLCSNHLVTNLDNSSHSCNLQSNRFCKQNFSHASLFKFVINSNRNNNKNSLTLMLCESSAIPRLVNSLCKCSANCQSREPPCLERPGRAASTGAQRDEAGLPRRVTPEGGPQRHVFPPTVQ